MFECKACIRRHIRIVLASVLNTRRPPIPSSSLRLLLHNVPRNQRGYATKTVSFDGPPSPSPTLDAGIRNSYVPSASRPQNRDEPFSKPSLERELLWLKDPLKLGDYTLKLLRQDDTRKALALVRVASKDMACTVSWNYMIDYYMSKGKVADAVKLYNEVWSCYLGGSDGASMLIDRRR